MQACIALVALAYLAAKRHPLNMTTKLNSPEVNTLTEFTKLIEERLAASNGILWHRGCADFDNHRLSPGLYRHPAATGIKELLELEVKMLSHFKQRSIPFVDSPLRHAWECLFFMQHFEIPTRLLDWTENPFIALYFALTSKVPDSDSAIWMLDPIAWNRKSLDYMDFKEDILSVDDTRLDYLKPGAGYGTMNADPLAIYGYHNSARIVAQRGVFTIFGKDTGPMEKIYGEKDYPEDCLLKVRLPKDKKADLLSSLFKMGFTHSVVFPDLEGLARETKHFFGFTV
jgi:FRG domain